MEKMLDMLTSAYNRRDLQNVRRGRDLETNIGRLLAIFAWGLDMIQDNADRIRLWDDLENAEGAVLDRYGANFGVSREGTTDQFYRLLIRVKMMAQLSGGDMDTVIQAAAQLFNLPEADIVLKEIFPAKVWIDMNGNLLDEEHREAAPLIIRMMKRIIAAGIGILIAITVTLPTIEKTLYITPVMGRSINTIYLPELAWPEEKEAA